MPDAGRGLEGTGQSRFEVGFPMDFLTETAGWVYGDAGQLVDGRESTRGE